MLSKGNMAQLFKSPVSIVLIALILVALSWPTVSGLLAKSKKNR